MLQVEIYPLAPRIPLPQSAPSRTRAEVPLGYGVQEQCLPFVAATGLGVLIPSPITFGLCLPQEAPSDALCFRSPIPDRTCNDARIFYIKDDVATGYVGNAYTVQGASGAWYEPGISFFDRGDQVDLFKVHLPYVWRTPWDVDTLFLPPLNRTLPGLTLLCGLVETGWYPNPVNLVFRKPTAERSVHVSVGEPVAQAIFLPRDHGRPTLKLIDKSDDVARSFDARLEQWRNQKARNRSAYKRLSRASQA